MALATPLGRKQAQEVVNYKVSMKRLGTPQEIADSVIFLAGGRSFFITGVGLCVDGGYTQR